MIFNDQTLSYKLPYKHLLSSSQCVKVCKSDYTHTSPEYHSLHSIPGMTPLLWPTSFPADGHVGEGAETWNKGEVCLASSLQREREGHYYAGKIVGCARSAYCCLCVRAKLNKRIKSEAPNTFWPLKPEIIEEHKVRRTLPQGPNGYENTVFHREDIKMYVSSCWGRILSNWPLQ